MFPKQFCSKKKETRILSRKVFGKKFLSLSECCLDRKKCRKGRKRFSNRVKWVRT